MIIEYKDLGGLRHIVDVTEITSICLRERDRDPIIFKKEKSGEIIRDGEGRECPICGGMIRDLRVNYMNFCNRCGADLRGGDR